MVGLRLLLALTSVCAFALADQIVLKNGDRVTGEILTSDAKTVTVKTESMGEVKIQRDGIVSIETARPLNVTLESGERVVGTISTEGESIKVRRADATEATASLASLPAIRDDDRQKAWEREQRRLADPPLSDFWTGTVDIGLATAQGNARTTTVSTGASAARKTGLDKISLDFSQIYSTQNTQEPFGKTANRVSGGARYDRDLVGRVFAFGNAAFDFDEFQDLDLRSVLGGGLGGHIYKGDNGFWDFGAGGAWNREKFSTGLVRNSAELILSEGSRHRLSSLLEVFQKVSAYPNLSDTGEYRLNFDGGLDLRLNRFMSWAFVLSDRFLSNPLPGNKRNDLLVTTGLKLTFDQR